MDSSSFSTALFAHLQHDLCVRMDDQGTRFDPFPFGRGTDLSTDRFARVALLTSIFKKSEVESSESAEQDTLSDFLTANKFCGHQRKENFYENVADPAVGYSITAAQSLLHTWFTQQWEESPPITMASIEVAARFGPGRSVGLKDKPSLLYFKVGDSKQTASSEFIRSWYESSVAYNPVCEAAEMARQARHGRAEICKFGTLSFVPKSYSRRRIVVTEPSLNTYFQLGLGKGMEEVLRKFTGIDLSKQPAINAELAREGSVNGLYATVDLKQCSDYISRALVEFMFPPSLVRWLKCLRTPSVSIKLNGKSSKIPLWMMSTMGNGFTFPLQTALLTAVVLGVYNTLDIPVLNHEAGPSGTEKPSRTYGVFGDDIVVRTEAYPLLLKTLTELGLMVNQEKSFNSGSFRESCGHDYYNGRDIRGIYLKRYATDQDYFSAFNRLAQWSAKHNVPLVRTLKFIATAIAGVTPVVPPDEQVTAGVRTPEPPCDPDGDGLWHYYPYRPRMSSLRFEFWHNLEFGELPQGSRVWKKFSRWLGDLTRYCDGSLNEPALLKVLLAGGLRRYSMPIRDETVTYKQISQVTPRWGFTEDETFPEMGTVEAIRLQSLIEFVIGGLLD